MFTSIWFNNWRMSLLVLYSLSLAFLISLLCFDVLACWSAYACGIRLSLVIASLVSWSESASRLVISSACLDRSFLGIWARVRAFFYCDGEVRGHSRRTSDGGRGVMGKCLYMYALLGVVLNR